MSDSAPPPPAPSERRHDLDALRAFAMLLGIVLHAGLSFTELPWIVQDVRQSSVCGLLFSLIHGFRMPLFFMVSGFFTAMLWQKRGPRTLLWHRTKRILFPCLLGLATIVPITQGVFIWVIMQPLANSEGEVATFAGAIREGNLPAVEKRLAEGEDPNGVDERFKAKLLSWAAMAGDPSLVQALIDGGAEVNCRNADGATPLHSAAFLGRDEAFELLLSAGADPEIKNYEGRRPSEGLDLDWGTTQFIANLLGVELESEEALQQGRERIRELLAAEGAEFQSEEENTEPPDLIERYLAVLESDLFSVGSMNLFNAQIFAHLWFLWFLCWLVPIFLVVTWVSSFTGLSVKGNWLVVTPACLLWLLPLMAIPQWFMGTKGPAFGPDTSLGLLPIPHVLLYYAIFFLFGSLYYFGEDTEGRLGRGWGWMLLLAVCVCFPVGLATLDERVIACAVQPLFAWAMTLGMLGLFRRFLPSENAKIRYLSDSSYWLYLAHLPLVVFFQGVVRDWELPLVVKFGGICLVSTSLLLISYEYLVRYTPIGTLLNGKRKRAAKATTPTDEPTPDGAVAG